MTPLTKTLYTTDEVCGIVGITRNTLYRWIREFDQLSPKAGPGRYKRYTKADIELCRRIRELICDQGLPIKTARTKIALSYRSQRPRGSYPCRTEQEALKLLTEALAMTDGNDHVTLRLLSVLNWLKSTETTASVEKSENIGNV